MALHKSANSLDAAMDAVQGRRQDDIRRNEFYTRLREEADRSVWEARNLIIANRLRARRLVVD